MKIHCAWCDQYFDDHTIDQGHQISEDDSHGICLDCIINLRLFDVYDLSDIPNDIIKACIEGEFVVDKNHIVTRYSTKVTGLEELIQEKIIGKNILTEIAPLREITGLPTLIDKLTNGNQTRQDTLTVLVKNSTNFAFVSIDILYDGISKGFIILTKKLKEK